MRHIGQFLHNLAAIGEKPTGGYWGITTLSSLLRGVRRLKRKTSRSLVDQAVRMRTVFVCHSSKNKIFAEEIVSFLERNGIPCWIAPRDIEGSHIWGRAIIDAISNSRALLLLFSDEANESPHVLREVERAVHKRIPVLPLKLSNATPSPDLEYFISACQWIDRNPEDPETSYRSLLKTLEDPALLARSQSGSTSLPAARQHGVHFSALSVHCKELTKKVSSVVTAHAPKLTQSVTPTRLVLALSFVAFVMHLFGSDQGKHLLASVGLSRHVTLSVQSPEPGKSVVGDLLTYSWSVDNGTSSAQFEVERTDLSGKTVSDIVSSNSLVETKLQGTMKWRVRSRIEDEDGEVSYGPWTTARQVTYFRNELERVIHSKVLQVKVVADEDVTLATRFGIQEQARQRLLEALAAIFKSRSITDTPHIEFSENSEGSQETIEADAELLLTSSTSPSGAQGFFQWKVAQESFILLSKTALPAGGTSGFGKEVKVLGARANTRALAAAEALAQTHKLTVEIIPEELPDAELVEKIMTGALDGYVTDTGSANTLVGLGQERGLSLHTTSTASSKSNSELPNAVVAFLRIPHSSGHLGEVLSKSLDMKR